MGIHLLQTFIASLNDRSIKEQHLREFSNKKITVDISIYLYRFKEKGNHVRKYLFNVLDISLL